MDTRRLDNKFIVNLSVKGYTYPCIIVIVNSLYSNVSDHMIQ